jgi:TPR repeat protein
LSNRGDGAILSRTIEGNDEMKRGIWTLAAIMLVAVAMPVTAGPLEDGLTAYREHDYATALALWRPLADKGNPAAQYQLGTLYAEGKGVAQSDATAVQWFQRAADQGDAASQYNLAVSFAEGLGVPKDDASAAKWFRRAADQGMPYAQLNLGFLYATRRGVTPDDVEAVKWLELAIFALPPGGARSDAARMLKEVADKLTEEQLLEARIREKAWKAKPEIK